MRSLILAAFLFGCVQGFAVPKWFDQSHEIFLTPKLNTMASNYRDYPIFWWNFLILDGESKWSDIDALCAQLSLEKDLGIQKLPCHFDLTQLKGLTQDWLRDLPLRTTMPTEHEYIRRLQETLLKASLPMDRGLIDLLRMDPFNSLQDLKARVQKRMQMDLKLRGGFLVDEKSKRILIPIQFSFSPADSERTQAFVATLDQRCAGLPGCTSLALFGPHASTSENESQIRADVDVVSVLGIGAMGVLCFFILMSGRRRLLNLVPLLLFSIGISIWVTILVFGKIHGITLAFGPGIVGLSMDYGIHSAFLDPRSRETWRANLVGLLTTIVIMIVLGFSVIPLLRQMMFFATFGLCFNYLIFYLTMPRWPQLFESGFYNFKPSKWRPMNALAILFLVCAPLIFFRPLHLDVQHLNFETAKTVDLRQWFFKMAGAGSPYLIVEHSQAPLESSTEHLKWAASQEISYEGIAGYLPEPDTQARNLMSWRRGLCAGSTPETGEIEKKFFAPFFNFTECQKLVPNLLTREVPDYLKDFHHAGRFVGLFFPKDEAQIAALSARFPQASTPREIFSSFPKILYSELLWMIPLALIGAFFFLWLHYRRVGWSTLAVIPFLTGLGCYALMSVVFQIPVSFISMIGLIMVFGCSLDYGVFVMDFLLFRKEDRPGVWSALTLCSFATIAGFAPLVFAHHPVLRDLGHALLWGTVGTYVGSLWGIPSVYGVLEKWKRNHGARS